MARFWVITEAVDFERVYYNYGDGAEMKREKYVLCR
jgi:hypothetical protein